MCIVCEIRNKLGSEVANEEVVSFVMERVELMAATMQGLIDEGREVLEHKRVNRQKFGAFVKMASCCLSDEPGAIEERNKAIAFASVGGQNTDAIDKLAELLAFALLGRSPRSMRAGTGPTSDPRKPDGLPDEVWEAMPDELKDMLEGSKVLSMEAGELPSDLLARLFGHDDKPKH